MNYTITDSKRNVFRVLVIVLTTLLSFGFSLSQANVANAAANRTSQKVTICHRTHAVTNPYRQITVSVNSVIKNNGHHDNTHNPNYTGKPVFDPTFNYPANGKQWQDIIPAFYYSVTSGGTTTTTYFAGRNWNADGKAIYYGLGTKAGLCSGSGAKEFAQTEYAEWLADFPGQNGGQQPSNGDITSKKRDIINDLKEQENIDDGDLSSFTTDFDALPATPRKPKGPDRPQDYSDLITEVDNYNSTKPVNKPINQALAGVVWKDMDSDGIQDVGEEVFGNLGIQIIDPTTNLPLTPAEVSGLTQLASYVPKSQPLFAFAGLAKEKTTYSAAVSVISVTTDANGYFEIPSLPEGDWQVNVITPDGWSYTYDSAGSSDGQMPGTYVPSGGAGFAWAGLVYVGTTSGGTGGTGGAGGSGAGSTGSGTAGKSALSTTGFDSTWILISIAALTVVGAGLLVTSYLRPEEEESEAY